MTEYYTYLLQRFLNNLDSFSKSLIFLNILYRNVKNYGHSIDIFTFVDIILKLSYSHLSETRTIVNQMRVSQTKLRCTIEATAC